MKLKVWNWLNKIIGSILFAFWVSLLIDPWFKSLNSYLEYAELNIFQILWIVIVILMSLITVGLIKSSDTDYIKTLKLAILLGVNIFILWWWGWPLLIFIPITLILILFSFRYEIYESSSAFLFDFTIATIILLLNIILSYNSGLTLNVYTNVILFFIISILLSFVFNLKNMDIFQYSFRPRTFLIVIGIFIIAVIIPGLFLGLSLKTSFFEGILLIVKYGFRGIGYILLGIIYPILRLLAPVLNFFGDIELEPREEETQTEGAQTPEQELPEKMEPKEGLDIEFLSFIPYILWGLLVLLILWLIYRFIKKMFKSKDKEDVEKGYTEERETVFSMEELRQDFRDLWESLNVFKGNKKETKREYNDTPSEIIREIYYKCLIKYNKVFNFKQYFTPNEYFNNIKDKIQNREYYQELTNLYNKVRYGKKVEQEDVKKAQKLWNDIKNNENE